MIRWILGIALALAFVALDGPKAEAARWRGRAGVRGGRIGVARVRAVSGSVGVARVGIAQVGVAPAIAVVPARVAVVRSRAVVAPAVGVGVGVGVRRGFGFRARGFRR